MNTEWSQQCTESGPGASATVRSLARDPDREAALARIAELTEESLSRHGIGLNLADSDLSNLDLSGFDLRKACLNRAKLHATRLDRALLAGASLICAGLERTHFVDADLSGAYLHAIAAQVCDFTGANFKDALDMTGGLYHGCMMDRANFEGAVLSGTSFYQCRLSEASLQHAEAKGASFNECQLDGADFGSAQLDHTVFLKCQMDNVSLTGTIGPQLAILRPSATSALRLERAMLPGLRLSEVDCEHLDAAGLRAPSLDMSRCNLRRTDLSGADLQGARIAASHLADANFSRSNLTGATLQGTNFDRCDFSRCSAETMTSLECTFRAARFTGIRGRAAVFRDCNMSGALLQNAYLYRAMLTGDPVARMSMRGADLSGAELIQACVSADLTGARLVDTQLAYARLNQSILDEATLSCSRPYATTLVKTSMRGAKIKLFEPPFFIDRCVGFEAAIEAIPDHLARQRTKKYAQQISSLIESTHRRST